MFTDFVYFMLGLKDVVDASTHSFVPYVFDVCANVYVFMFALAYVN